MTEYFEFAAASNFSFLRGASHPEELMLQAAHIGLAGLGLCDRNSVAGVVRAHLTKREKELALTYHPGARLVGDDDIRGMIDGRTVARSGQREAVRIAGGCLGGCVGFHQQTIGGNLAEVIEARIVFRLEQLDVKRVVRAQRREIREHFRGTRITV